jgi:phosphohistidine swiveling domain-containing protein
MTSMAFGRVFEAPRPGAWEIDLTHFPRPTSRFVSEVYLDAFKRGFAESSRRYGLLLSHMDYVQVHGFLYAMPRAVGAPESAKGPPPKPIFKLLTWLHPEVRRRIRTSERVLRERSWLRDLAHWDNEAKPQAIAEHLAVQRVDPRSLDTAQLAEHVRLARQNAERGIYRHGRFTMTACLPLGDYLAHVKQWTDLPVHTLLQPVRGFSAVSNGVAAPELSDLVRLLRETPSARVVLEAAPATALQLLREQPGPIGVAARAWLDQVSFRIVTGYDICDRYALEMPEMLVGGLRAELAAEVGKLEDSAAVEQDAAKLRAAVPSGERALFDQLLADARAVYRLREERDHYNDGWSTGLLRRAMLEVGRRVADSGRIANPELIVDAGVGEALALLSGEPGPTQEELAARAEWRNSAEGALAPPALGFPASPPPPADWLPPSAARLARGTEIFLFSLFQPSERESTHEVMRGIPVSPGVYEGPARVVRSSEDFDRVRHGDVLVAPSTSPYFNVLLPLLGAIVTDRGGALSHAAIVAREYGIPGVVGAKVATTRIQTGDRIRVDGAAGEVRMALA